MEYPGPQAPVIPLLSSRTYFTQVHPHQAGIDDVHVGKFGRSGLFDENRISTGTAKCPTHHQQKEQPTHGEQSGPFSITNTHDSGCATQHRDDVG